MKNNNNPRAFSFLKNIKIACQAINIPTKIGRKNSATLNINKKMAAKINKLLVSIFVKGFLEKELFFLNCESIITSFSSAIYSLDSKFSILIIFNKKLYLIAAELGFEPRYHTPEVCVLPLDDPAILKSLHIYLI